MNKTIFKTKFTLFNKKRNEKKGTSPSTGLNKMNQNSIWLQSMEPIQYAKKYSEKLYEIDSFKTEKVEMDLFTKELFSNLKLQLDQKVSLIKKTFFETSDGSLNVGLNSILIDSLLKIIFKKIYYKVFSN